MSSGFDERDYFVFACAAFIFIGALWGCLAACECEWAAFAPLWLGEAAAIWGRAISAAAGRRRKRRRMANLHSGEFRRWNKVSANHLSSPCRPDEIDDSRAAAGDDRRYPIRPAAADPGLKSRCDLFPADLARPCGPKCKRTKEPGIVPGSSVPVYR